MSKINRPLDFIIEYRISNSIQDFSKKYNIIVNDDGSIYDPKLKTNFKCLQKWAKARYNSHYNYNIPS